MLGEGVADLGDGAVAVVGRALDEDARPRPGRSPRGDLLVGGAFELARALLDGALDVVGGHVHALGLLHRGAQAGIRDRVAAADAGGDGHLADDLGEDLPALGVERALLVLDGCPLGMSGHAKSPAVCGSGPARRRRYRKQRRNRTTKEKPRTGLRDHRRALSEVTGRMRKKSRQRPTLPPGCPGSTIGAGGLNGRVRNGNGCDPSAMVTGMNLSKNGVDPRRILFKAWSARRRAPRQSEPKTATFQTL